MPISKVPHITQVTQNKTEKRAETKSSPTSDRNFRKQGSTTITRRPISQVTDDKETRQCRSYATDLKSEIDKEKKWRRQSDTSYFSTQRNPLDGIISEKIPVSILNTYLNEKPQDNDLVCGAMDFPKIKDNEEVHMESIKRKQEIDILLIGKTGNGKSALGNSILKKNAFNSKPSASSVTKEISSGSAVLSDKIINVFDSPGVNDTGFWDEDDSSEIDIERGENEATKLVLNAMSGAISANPKGYHAFILVLKFGDRFKIEDYKVVQFLKDIFGKQFLNKYCIIVMTFGDNFSRQVNGSFQEWLEEQEKPLADVLKECNYRVVLFDNITENKDIKENQRVELLNFLEELILDNCRYTNDEFDLAKSTRNILLLESNIPDIFNELNAIVKVLKNCQEHIEKEENLKTLEELLTKTNNINEKLQEKNIDITLCTELNNNVESVKESIMNELKIVRKLNELKAEQKLLVAKEKAKAYEIKTKLEKETNHLKMLLETEKEKASNFQNEMIQIQKKYNKTVYKKIKSKVIKSLNKIVTSKHKTADDNVSET